MKRRQSVVLVVATVGSRCARRRVEVEPFSRSNAVTMLIIGDIDIQRRPRG